MSKPPSSMAEDRGQDRLSRPIPRLRGLIEPTLSSLIDEHDALVLAAPAASLASAIPPALEGALAPALEAATRADASLRRGPRPPIVLPFSGAPGGRVVIAPTGALTDDLDDVRSVAEAASAAIARAVDAGARRPALSIAYPSAERFARALDVAALAALGSQWAPLEAREAEKAPACAESVSLIGLDEARAARAAAVELGRYLCRDIAGTEPERMTPLRVAEYCEAAFAGTGVSITTTRDTSPYPLLDAVARASRVVERHRPCVVRLEYGPPSSSDVHRTLILVGKGVAYDTGGADLKTDGHMAGMSRDKGGAAAVAGLIRAAAAMRLPNVRVVGLLGLVRNSVGEESYVSDEIIRSRAGVRVRVGNTDAEGRLILADLLAEAGSIAAGAPDPLILSIATLTGHVYRAYGPYVGAIGNAAARRRGDLQALDALAELWAEPMEQSRPRREDYSFVAARSSAEDVVSSNRLASVNTPRGHQFPFAFLDIASGLRGSSHPFIHMDISGAACDPPDWQFGRPTGSPIATLAAFLAGVSG